MLQQVENIQREAHDRISSDDRAVLLAIQSADAEQHAAVDDSVETELFEAERMLRASLWRDDMDAPSPDSFVVRCADQLEHLTATATAAVNSQCHALQGTQWTFLLSVVGDGVCVRL